MAITKKPIQDNARAVHEQQHHANVDSSAASARSVTHDVRDTQQHVQVASKSKKEQQQHSDGLGMVVLKPTANIISSATAANIEVMTPEWSYSSSERCDFSYLLVKEQRRMGTSRGQKATPQAPAIVVRASGLREHAVSIRADLWDYGPSTNARGARINPQSVDGGEQLVKLRDDVMIACTENITAFGPTCDDGYRYATVRCYITRGARVRCRKDHIALRLALVSEDSKGIDPELEAIIKATKPERTARISISEKAMCPRECDRRKKETNIQKRTLSGGPVLIARRPSPLSIESCSTSSSRATFPLNSLAEIAGQQRQRHCSFSPVLTTKRTPISTFSTFDTAPESSLLGFCPSTTPSTKRATSSRPGLQHADHKRARYNTAAQMSAVAAPFNPRFAAASDGSAAARRLSMSIDNIKMQLKLGEMKMAQLGLPLKNTTSSFGAATAGLEWRSNNKNSNYNNGMGSIARRTPASHDSIAGMLGRRASAPVASFQNALSGLPTNSLVHALKQLDSFPDIMRQLR